MVTGADTNVFKNGIQQSLSSLSADQPIVDEQLFKNFIGILAPELINFGESALDNCIIPNSLR